MHQFELIPTLDTSRKAARASALQAAKARGETGMERAAVRADRERPGWCEDACEALRGFARAQGGVFTLELARLALEQAGGIDRPHDGRAWGKVAVMALKRNFIEKVKGQFFPAASSNGAAKCVYRRSVKA